MKTIDLSTIFAFVGAIGVIGGILAWFLSRLLDDRLDAKESKMEIGYLKEKFAKLEKDFEKVERWYNNDKSN